MCKAASAIHTCLAPSARTRSAPAQSVDTTLTVQPVRPHILHVRRCGSNTARSPSLSQTVVACAPATSTAASSGSSCSIAATSAATSASQEWCTVVLVAILKHAQGLTIRLTANHLCPPSNAPSCRSDTDLRQRNTPEMTHAIITICSSGAVVSSRFFIAPLLSTRSLATYDAAFATQCCDRELLRARFTCQSSLPKRRAQPPRSVAPPGPSSSRPAPASD